MDCIILSRPSLSHAIRLTSFCVCLIGSATVSFFNRLFTTPFISEWISLIYWLQSLPLFSRSTLVKKAGIIFLSSCNIISAYCMTSALSLAYILTNMYSKACPFAYTPRLDLVDAGNKPLTMSHAFALIIASQALSVCFSPCGYFFFNIGVSSSRISVYVSNRKSIYSLYRLSNGEPAISGGIT